VLDPFPEAKEQLLEDEEDEPGTQLSASRFSFSAYFLLSAAVDQDDLLAGARGVDDDSEPVGVSVACPVRG
jgi:hypothetical protein